MKNSPKPQPLKINVSDATITRDYLETYKKWFNGLKHFFTVKITPPTYE